MTVVVAVGVSTEDASRDDARQWIRLASPAIGLALTEKRSARITARDL
jgi:hypothetical protein